jgi:serine/threonine protein kinase
VIAPLLRILEKMHALALLHRDIKPENIFLTALGKFKLGDFGLAIKIDEELAFSRSGTLDYMAPEVRHGKQAQAWKGRGSWQHTQLVLRVSVNATSSMTHTFP